MRVEAGTGTDVVVEITRGGADAGKLRLETGEIDGRQTLRLIYPDDEITYPRMGRNSNTTLDVRDDGTFNDGHDRRDRHGHRGSWGGGRRVRISGSGRGLEAFADVRVLVPAGKRVATYLAVGKAFVTNVSGELRVDVAAADVTAERTKGSLLIDTGSGDVALKDADGDVDIDTGSGDVRVSGVRGGVLKLDTGSGDVTADHVEVSHLDANTGSGDVDVTAVKAPEIKLETGSGAVELGLLSSVESLSIDTGSGDVTLSLPPTFSATVDLDTGSGDIDLGGVTVRVRKLERDHITGEIGDGHGRVKIETGSGDITLQQGRSL
jgi:lia operon protein LiaG